MYKHVQLLVFQPTITMNTTSFDIQPKLPEGSQLRDGHGIIIQPTISMKAASFEMGMVV